MNSEIQIHVLYLKTRRSEHGGRWTVRGHSRRWSEAEERKCAFGATTSLERMQDSMLETEGGDRGGLLLEEAGGPILRVCHKM